MGKGDQVRRHQAKLIYLSRPVHFTAVRQISAQAHVVFGSIASLAAVAAPPPIAADLCAWQRTTRWASTGQSADWSTFQLVSSFREWLGYLASAGDECLHYGAHCPGLQGDNANRPWPNE